MIFAPKHPANCMKINRNWSVFGAAAHSGAEMKRYAKISFARNRCR
jgi:hypothetical protein